MELLKPELGLIFWTAVIFLTTFFLLRKFAWKAILKGLNDRENKIDDALKTADSMKREMANMKSEHEKLLTEAKQERSLILKEAKEAKEQIIAEARNKAKSEGAKLLEEARREINNQKMAAITEVKNAAGQLVLQVSEQVLRHELAHKGEQEKFIAQEITKAKLN